MAELILKLVFGCLNCDKPIPMKIARKGIQICSKKCMKKLNKLDGHWDLSDVWRKNG